MLHIWQRLSSVKQNDESIERCAVDTVIQENGEKVLD